MWLSTALAAVARRGGPLCPRAAGPTRSSAPTVAMCLLLTASLFAQAPAPIVRMTFKDAIDRAVEKNPSVAAATAGILRDEGLIRQAHATTRLQVNGNVTTTTLNTGVEFQGSTVTPQNQVTASLTADMPILAGAAWARRAQALDTRMVAELTVADVKRQIAFAPAHAYLTIVRQHPLVGANLPAG